MMATTLNNTQPRHPLILRHPLLKWRWRSRWTRTTTKPAVRAATAGAAANEAVLRVSSSAHELAQVAAWRLRARVSGPGRAPEPTAQPAPTTKRCE